ncbi:MAG: hypothetical protein HRT45_08695 [Bdellovibrionales bacterium]|nr:hypothetical protein [Bdellovibrionales bacterium]
MRVLKMVLLLICIASIDLVLAAEEEVSVQRNVSLRRHPHLIDTVLPELVNAQTKVVVVLHGGGGSKEGIAINLGLLDRETGQYNTQFLAKQNLGVVFVGGMSIKESPGATGWTNHVMVSGQEDMSMLRDISLKLRHGGFQNLYLIGHSMGGVMVNRVWSEQPELFSAYGSSAGPMAASLLKSCRPSDAKPYIQVTGNFDRILQIVEETRGGELIDHSSDLFLNLDPATKRAAGEAMPFESPDFANELVTLQWRSKLMCESSVLYTSTVPRRGRWQQRSTIACGGRILLVELNG